MYAVVGKWLKIGAGLLVLAWLLSLLRVSGTNFEYDGAGITDADSQLLDSYSQEYLASGLNKYKPFFAHAEYESFMLSKASFVSSLDAATSLLNSSLEVKVVPKLPLFQLETSQVLPGGNSLWVATDGSIIELSKDQIANAAQTLSEIAVIDRSGVEYSSGDYILSQQQITYIQEAPPLLEEHKLAIESVELTDNLRNLQFNLAAKPYHLIVSPERPVEVLSVDLAAILKQIQSGGEEASQYIDLTVIDKAFYR